MSTPGTITIQDSLIALKRQEGTFNPSDSAGHLFMFKWDDAAPCKLRLRNVVMYMKQNNNVFNTPLDPRSFVTECSDVTLVYTGSGSYTADSTRLAELRSKFPDNCFTIKSGTITEKQEYWRQQRDNWFARHANNAQISAYRYQEPSGVSN